MQINKPDYYNDLDKTYLKIWSLLENGLAKRDAAFHIPVFINGNQNIFDGRIVVLRGISQKERKIWFHSDIRSSKVKIIKSNPQASLLFYDKSEKIQLRIGGTTKINYKNDGNEKYIINGIENRIEQIVANLLDNSISFCKEGENIFVNISNTEDKKILVKIIDDGQGFKEKDTSKIFKRFYSNRPDKFGEHSGLGLNIVKNLVDLHDGEIVASNRLDRDGAIVEIKFPSV